MTEIWPVNDADGAVIDVVFLHGLNGDGRKTWMRDVADPASFWPQWLAEDVEHVAVWTVHYDAWASRYLGHSMALEDRAKSVMDQLRNKRLGERPLCFIAHSMGGLLVKEILMHSSQGRTEFRTFARQTRGVVFLATPHTGSALATMLDTLPRAVRQTPAVRDLRREDPHLRQLGDDYRDWVAESGLKHKVYSEMHGKKGVLVVQPSSANPGLAGVPSIPVDADHAAICKPLNRDVAVYAGVRVFVESLVAEVTRPPPADLPTFVPRPIHGRGETLDKVRASLARSVLVELSGTYGIGKTAIATQLARETATEAHAVYLSARGSPGVTVSSVLEALAASVDSPHERERLADRLLAPDMDVLARLDAILDRLRASRVLLIVDDAQELRASPGELRDNIVGELRDEALANLIRAIVRRPGHNVQFLFVTAEPLLKRAHPREPVRQGLTEEPFGEFIGDLEADGEVGLRMMPAGEMRELLGGGHPRTTELVYGIRSGSATPVRDLVSIAGDPERLDRALMASLGDLDREALRSLAIFSRPAGRRGRADRHARRRRAGRPRPPLPPTYSAAPARPLRSAVGRRPPADRADIARRAGRPAPTGGPVLRGRSPPP
ncbi:AAA family ATPase [Actinoplanes aureus]|uniref:AAA family ATPase n=1 Tax=Actinoplanes aureus TaxID=2792083 RepID=A0A931G345_9ACTN|nr:AAA family ATPase [Actinoplanes aureus]MBG0568452.1 AAA family ATPase [Actinoplanes aureus]